MHRPTQAPWWQGAILYQIYPRSFCDANGDGVGDLPGLLQKLDHVADLGVEGLWIFPFYPSPMRDFGYDVLDHCAVAPAFGTLADFDRVVERAHQLGLRVLIDQVWSHTAIEHPWFAQSRASRSGPKADWYVWADARPDGSPPTNWQSWMGGPTWTWDAAGQQYYLHNFLATMPDLNLHNSEVQDALLAVGRFWLDRGVDGFRLGTVNYYCHDPQLRDNPPRALEGPPDCPAALQRHVHDVCQPQTLAFLTRIRALLDGYGQRLSVAEIGSEHNLERMQEYTCGTHSLHTAYSFVLLGDPLACDQLASLMAPWQVPPEQSGWPSWALSNHDARRVATRWAGGDAAKARVLTWVLLALRGNAFIYQGEELGLPQAELAREDIRDPVGLAHWPRNPGRDGCRTPMPWQGLHPQVGFSPVRPWLPVGQGHAGLAVDVQRADPDSHLSRTREALHWRRRHTALRRGDFAVLLADAELLVALRRSADDAVLVAFNLGPQPWAVPLPQGLEPSGDSLSLHGSVLEPVACNCLPARPSTWRSDSQPAPHPMNLADHYQQQGYLICHDLVDADTIARLRQETLDICAGRCGAVEGLQALRHGSDDERLAQVLAIHFPHKLSPLVRAMLTHPPIVEVVRQLVGPDVKCMQSMLFVKNAGKPGQAWHQDEAFIPTRDASLIGVWIALDDAAVDNGCLWVQPGSHRARRLWPSAPCQDPRFDGSPEAVGWPGEREGGVAAEVPAGAVVFFNGHTLHRSLNNARTSGYRRALVLHMMSAHSELPWAYGHSRHAPHDYRDVVLVCGSDPHADRGLEDLARPFLRPEHAAT